MAESKQIKVTYLGPAHELEHEGKIIRPGDPLVLEDQAAAERLVGRGHSLGGYEGLTPAQRMGYSDARDISAASRALDEYNRSQGAPVLAPTPAEALVQERKAVDQAAAAEKKEK